MGTKQLHASCCLMQGPIVAGREPTATEAEAARGTERSNELSGIVNDFILRRTNALLSAHLPPKARNACMHARVHPLLSRRQVLHHRAGRCNHSIQAAQAAG